MIIRVFQTFCLFALTVSATIFVPGYKLTTDCQLDRILKERLETALQLWNSSERIIVSGGRVDCKHFPESDLMFEYLVLRGGVNSSLIETDGASADTIANALFANSLTTSIKGGEDDSFCDEWKVVTSDFHIPRVKKLFELALNGSCVQRIRFFGVKHTIDTSAYVAGESAATNCIAEVVASSDGMSGPKLLQVIYSNSKHFLNIAYRKCRGFKLCGPECLKDQISILGAVSHQEVDPETTADISAEGGLISVVSS